MRLKPILCALPALAAFALLGCLIGPQAGRGSEVENEVYGVLVDERGNALAGAKVKIQPAGGGLGKASAADPDSMLTNAQGKYSFRDLDTGTYEVSGDYQSGSLVSLRAGIAVPDTGVRVDLGADTLRPPGRIRGRLLLGDQGKGGALCYVPGTSYLAISDDSGFCLLSGVPQGVYRVAYSAPGFLIPADSGVEVLSTRTTPLPDKRLEYDPAQSPPAPTGLRAAYDTARETVTLFWDAVPVSDLEGFVVYRDEPGYPEPPPLRDGFTTATSFADSSFGPLAEGEKRTLIYRVKARDRESNVSGRFSSPCSVEAVSKSRVATIAGFSFVGAPGGRATPGDTVRFILAYANPARAILSIAWSSDDPAVPARKAARSGREGKDTLVFVTPSPRSLRVEALLEDETGAVWRFPADLEIVADPPKAVLRAPAQAFAGDTARVDWSGSSDSAGKVRKIEARFGGAGEFAAVAGKDSLVSIPASARGGYTIELRVTDDDGNVAGDSLSILVIGKGRWTRLTDSASPVDENSFKAAEMRGRAWIVATGGVFSSSDRVAWDSVGRLPVEALGVWSLAAYRDKLYCFVYGSDGMVSVFASADGAAWEKVPGSHIFMDAEGKELTAVPFQDKLFLYRTWQGTAVKTETYSWDGSAWKRESTPPAFTGRANIHPIEWSGRLWIYGGHTSTTIPGAIEDDVWSSSDGIAWSKVADAVGGYREWAQILPCGDRLVLAGGDDEFAQSRPDIWASADGVHWMPEAPVPGFIGAADAVAVRAGTAGYLYGGLNREQGWLKSIWKCE